MPAVGLGTPEEDLAAIEAIERRRRAEARRGRQPVAPKPTGSIEVEQVERPESVSFGWMRSGLRR